MPVRRARVVMSQLPSAGTCPASSRSIAARIRVSLVCRWDAVIRMSLLLVLGRVVDGLEYAFCPVVVGAEAGPFGGWGGCDRAGGGLWGGCVLCPCRPGARAGGGLPAAGSCAA